MEDVLHEYVQPYDASHPRVCVDEGSVQLLSSKREGLDLSPGQLQKEDYEYQRQGYANIFLATEPLAGHRFTLVTARRTKVEFAQFLRQIAQSYPDADTIILILDNLNTHQLGALYSVFEAEEASQLCHRFELHYTPLHGSWLNMAEIELSVLARQVLHQRLSDFPTLQQQVQEWQTRRNREQAAIHWRFTTADARIKLKRLYPSIEMLAPAKEGPNEG